MKRLLGLSMVVVAAALTTGVTTCVANSSWPSRTTPSSSAIGWFKAINAHDRGRLLFYVAPDARSQMGWARRSATWPKFSDLHCRSLKDTSRNRAKLHCTFVESAAPTAGNPDSFWNISLRKASGLWLIESYGQG